MKRHRFETLDAWRGIAATVVAVFHLVVYSHLSDLPFIRHAWIFVDFFFVLSGFVITHTYYDDLQQNRSFGNFALRRFGRLWPLHILMLAVFVALEATKAIAVHLGYAAPQPLFSVISGNSISELVQNVFLVQSIAGNPTNTWNGVAWSISTEFWAYAAFAVFCLLPRRAATAGALLIAASSAAIVALYSEHYMETSYDFGMFRCLYGFFTGYVVYRIWQAYPAKLRHPGISEFLALTVIVGFVSFVQPNAWSMLAPLVLGGALWVFAFEAGPLSQAMRTRTTLTLGAWSYSIYMVHLIPGQILQKGAAAIERLTGKPTTLPMSYVPMGDIPYNFIFIGNKWLMDVVVLVYLIGVLAMASLTYRYVEEPGRRYFNALAKRYFPPSA